MSSEVVWTWVLFFFELIGLVGLWFVGKKFWWGWAIILADSFPWFVYSFIYGKSGFIAMSSIHWIVNFTNMRKWKSER